ncbi:GTP cyclohydrolase II-domain-containing protein [Phycomyces blakesleeanus]
MPAVFTLFGMNVVHDTVKLPSSLPRPTSYKEYVKFMSNQLYSPKAITPALQQDKLDVQCQVRARIPTMEGGEMHLFLYKNNKDTKEHMAIVYGDDIRSSSLDKTWENETIMNRVVRGAYYGRLEEIITDETQYTQLNAKQWARLAQQQAIAKEAWRPVSEAPLVRIHSECFTGETVHSARCDCGEQLDEAMRLMQQAGRGVIVYLRQEGRGIGLLEKLKAYNLQDLGHDTVAANLLLDHPADGRTYDIANDILKDLGLSEVRLLTNNPDKIEQLEAFGDIKVVDRKSMVPQSWSSSPPLSHTPQSTPKKELDKYLAVKVTKMRHMLDLPTSILPQ